MIKQVRDISEKSRGQIGITDIHNQTVAQGRVVSGRNRKFKINGHIYNQLFPSSETLRNFE